MLSCKDINHLASDHIDQNLPFFTKLKVRLHLFLCKDCRNFIKQFQLSVDAIKQAKPTPVEVNLDDNAIERQVQTLIKAIRQSEHGSNK